VTLASDTGTAADNYTSISTINVTGLESGATWQYKVDGETTWQAGTGTTIANITGDSAHTVVVQQTDLAGNVNTADTTYTFTLDTTPSASVITFVDYNFSAGATPTLTFTGNDFNSLLSSGENSNTDVKTRLDWSKLSYDTDGNTALGTIDHGFTVNDISSAYVLSNGSIKVTLNSTPAFTTSDTNYGLAGSAKVDRIDVKQGFLGTQH
jgi:hypothetical protein